MDERIKGYFDTNKSVNTIYTTSDGQAFVSEAKANSHAATLKKTEVTTYKRNESESDNDTGSEAVEAAKVKLLSLDLSADPTTLNQNELKKIKDILGLQSIDNKRPTLIEVLTAEQARLKEEIETNKQQ